MSTPTFDDQPLFTRPGEATVAPRHQIPPGESLPATAKQIVEDETILDGKPATHANGGTIGFTATSPAQADAWHATGLANGATTCEDPPGIREMNGVKMYLAYLRDHVGNKLCALYRLPKEA